ncbi:MULTISPECIES: o-succinylbenzoate synthase [Mammaliicoccus]|uniref:o-succinylbenzoate synthase n=1 Tax=Mammaliicoccus TaxID=2803850 RepID=UPI000CD0D942|nr:MULTISPECIES: o-succinylbenzoate synthase [Mammaliicoccus]MDQ7143475.1 o-succinylbenzoate synthase [Mammaliicoccus lentus]POA02642.1 o-succinylbenzoate synthase [Mammaliicoccus lentus]HBV04029.1 o-succinylbenzoate synthase [Staphylococcus sp.]
MLGNEMNFYTFTAEFKIPIKTPLIELDSREVLVVEWKDYEGNTFYGECNAFSTNWYHYETIQSVQNILTIWYENNKYNQLDSYDKASLSLESLNDYPNARSVMSMIFFQKFHKLQEIEVDYGATISGNLQEYFKSYNGRLPSRIKVKWNDNIKEDMKYLKMNYPEVKRAIDANGVLNTDIIKVLNSFYDENFIYIEQPFKELKQYKEVTNKLEIPVFIDESATSLEMIQKFRESNVIDGVVIKPSRVGGIDKALEIIQYCKENQLKVVIGGMYEFGLSSYFTAYLAQYSDLPSDITPSDYYFEDDFVYTSSKLINQSLLYSPPVVIYNKLKKIKSEM